jgi:serine/threonine-protein kinase
MANDQHSHDPDSESMLESLAEANEHLESRQSSTDARNDEPSPTTILSASCADSSEFVCGTFLDPESLESVTHYEIIKLLARGGMGSVYRAHDQNLGRDVAIKILRPEFVDKPEFLQRFHNEARVMSFLQHPGIAPIFDCGNCADGRPYHAMKLVYGETFSKQLAMYRGEASRLGAMLNVFAMVCHTLAYTHSQGIVHLDLKPSNVMVGRFGEVHLMDWGLSKRIDSIASGKASPITHAGVYPSDIEPPQLPPQIRELSSSQWSRAVQGTPAYMSPEQARGKPIDARTDVFGLGALLCEILTGQPPYGGQSTRRVYIKAARAELIETFERLDQLRADRSLIQLTKSCLAANPADRPESAEEVDLEMSRYRESALERLESDIDRFFDLTLDLFCIAGFDGIFRRVNSNFPRILGYSEAELVSRPFLDFVHKDDQEKTVQQMRVLFEDQPVVRFRNRYHTADGRCLVLEWTAQAVPEEKLIFAVARDVTE